MSENMDQERRNAQLTEVLLQCELVKNQLETLTGKVFDHTNQLAGLKTVTDTLSTRLNNAELVHQQYDLLLGRLEQRANSTDNRLSHIEAMLERTNELVAQLNNVFTRHSLEGLAQIIAQTTRVEKLIRYVLILIVLMGTLIVALRLWTYGVEAFEKVLGLVVSLFA